MTLMHLVAAAALVAQSTAAPKPPAGKPAAPPKAAAAKVNPGELPVTLTYKGKGTVDEKHKLIAWAFSDPNVTSASRPVGSTQFAAKNGATVTFKDLPATPVYIFAVYDETGNYDGVSGPPPAGLPCAMYRKTAKGAATPVTAGTSPITLTFTDAERWKK